MSLKQKPAYLEDYEYVKPDHSHLEGKLLEMEAEILAIKSKINCYEGIKVAFPDEDVQIKLEKLKVENEKLFLQLKTFRK